MNGNVTVVFIFSLYLVCMLAIGLKYYNKSETLSQYVLGGRKLNSWVTAMSSQASDMSGWLLMGLPGYAYLSGVEAMWIALGLGIGTYINWKVVAKRIRKYTEIAGNSITISGYFENRFRDDSKALRVISAIVILVFFTIYTSSGFVAGGKLFNAVFGMPYIYALTVSSIIVIAYTFLGGFMAVCWTDLIQGILMFFAVTAVPIVAASKVGGWETLITKWNSIDVNFMNPIVGISGSHMSAIAIISLLAWGLGYFGQPHILTKFMAIESSKKIKKARTIAMIWVVISLLAAVMIGMIGRIYLGESLKGTLSENVFIFMVNDIFNSVIKGILLSAILSAIMSTADSQLLVSSSALTEDIYKSILKKEASDKELVWVSRFTIIVISVIAYFMALNPQSSILSLVAYAWAGFGAAFGPVVLLSLFWKRATRNGALAGMIVGGVTVILWKNIHGGIFELYEIVPGILFATLTIIIVSLLDREPSKEIQDEFHSVSESSI